MLQDVLNKRVQWKAKTILESRFKKADHLGNLDDIGGEKIRAPDLNAMRGVYTRKQRFFHKGAQPD